MKIEDDIDVCIIDADSLIYQIAYTTANQKTAISNLDAAINKIIAKSGAEEVMVFIKGKDNFRFEADPDYKGHRVNVIADEVKARIDALYEYAREFAVESDYGEADDYCFITACKCIEMGKTYMVSHIDKDLDCIPGWHHNFKTGRIYNMDMWDCYRFLMVQLMAGDSTDNIKGVPGIGIARAAVAIRTLPNHMLIDKVLEMYQEKVTLEPWKDSFVRTANCIYLRDNEADLRPLSYEELLERFKWIHIGSNSQSDQQMPSDSSTISRTDTPDEDTSGENSSSLSQVNSPQGPSEE